MVIIRTRAVDVSIHAVSPALSVGAAGSAAASASWASAGSIWASASAASATTAPNTYLANFIFRLPLER